MARTYEVFRKATVHVLEAEPEPGDPGPHGVSTEVLIPCGTYTANGDAVACKMAGADDLKSGRLEGVTLPEYVAVGTRSFHEHKLQVTLDPQIGYAR